MKKNNKPLPEKNNEQLTNENKKMAKFLKRRRLELGLTLEHVSDGICSTSYLSKIENCQVDVDDIYYNLLFEKLDLKYQNVIESRKDPIYTKILKAYLENDKPYIEKLTNDLVVDKTYCETEVEILVIFYNLISDNYKEAKEGLDKINSIRNTLLEEELQIFEYLNAVYYFKTYDYETTWDYLTVLKKQKYESEILDNAVNDLMLDLSFFTNDLKCFYLLLRQQTENSYSKLLKRVRIKHELQELVLKPSNDKDAEFAIYAEFLEGKFQDLYDYYYVLSMVERRLYFDAYEYTKYRDYDQDFLALKAIAVNRIDDLNISYEFLMKLRETTLIENTSSFVFVEYFRIKLEKYSYMQLYTSLKNIIFSKEVANQNHYLYNELFKELLMIAYELGKYKEIIKLLKSRFLKN